MRAARTSGGRARREEASVSLRTRRSITGPAESLRDFGAIRDPSGLAHQVRDELLLLVVGKDLGLVLRAVAGSQELAGHRVGRAGVLADGAIEFHVRSPKRLRPGRQKPADGLEQFLRFL